MDKRDAQSRESLLRQALDASLAGGDSSSEVDDETLALLASGQLDALDEVERARVLDAVASDPQLLQVIHEVVASLEEVTPGARKSTRTVLFRFTGAAWLIAACLTLFLGLMDPVTEPFVQTNPGSSHGTGSKGGINTESIEIDPDRSETDTPRPHADIAHLPDGIERIDRPDPAHPSPGVLPEKPGFDADQLGEEKDKLALQDHPAVASGPVGRTTRDGFYLSLGVTILLTLVLAGFAIRGVKEDAEFT